MQRNYFWLNPVLALAIGMTYGLTCFTVQAEITLDGTLGPSGSLPGPDFVIPAEVGQQLGGNLFHSFGLFNIDATDVLADGSTINSSTASQESGGDINIITNGSATIAGIPGGVSTISSTTFGEGDAGNIFIETGRLNLMGDALILDFGQTDLRTWKKIVQSHKVVLCTKRRD